MLATSRMRSLVLVIVCSLAAYSQTCNVTGEWDPIAIICGNGWHVHFDHGICAQDGQVEGCHQDSDCVDGIHFCPESLPVWRCVIRGINGVTKGTCDCQRNYEGYVKKAHESVILSMDIKRVDVWS